jgi:hypothetical protein
MFKDVVCVVLKDSDMCWEKDVICVVLKDSDMCSRISICSRMWYVLCSMIVLCVQVLVYVQGCGMCCAQR